MATQPGIEVAIVYGVESTMGTPATAGGTSQALRKTQSTLNPEKQTFTSAEFASHQQIADMRHGVESVGGAIEGELSNATYDDFFQAVMRGTWTSGSSTGSQTLGATAPDQLTRAAGSFITDGFKIGDVVRATGYAGAGAGNNNVNWRITALTATAMTVSPVGTTNAVATIAGAAGVTISVVGSKLLMGTTKRSFTIEQNYPTIDVSERFDGCRINGFAVRMPPGAMATVGFQVLGLNATILSGANAPYFTSVTAETSTALMAGPSGIVRVNGADTLVATGLEVNVVGNLNSGPVIGSTLMPDIFHGQLVATGSFSCYMESGALADAFLSETEVDLQGILTTVDTTPASFLSFRAHRIKFTGLSKTITPNGGVIATYQWQALRKVGGAGTVYDTSTIVIQRSN